MKVLYPLLTKVAGKKLYVLAMMNNQVGSINENHFLKRGRSENRVNTGDA